MSVYPHYYPCTLEPPVGFYFIRMTQSKQLSTCKQERVNRFYSFQISDDVQLSPCALIEIMPRNLENVMREFFESNSLFIDRERTRCAQREYIFVPNMRDIPACHMSIWDFVAQYFDFNVIVDAELREILLNYVFDEQEKSYFRSLSLQQLSYARFRVIDVFRLFKSASLCIDDFALMPRLQARTFALCSYERCELLIQDIQEEREDPITNVNTLIRGVTSGILREVATSLGNALKPYMDRYGLFAARFTESPINAVARSEQELTIVCIGSGYSAIRPLLQFRRAYNVCSKINLIFSLRHRDDIGFMRSDLEELELLSWFNLYFIDSENDVEYGKQQMMLSIHQEAHCFTLDAQIVYSGKEQAFFDLKEPICDALRQNGATDEQIAQKWAYVVKYTWQTH